MKTGKEALTISNCALRIAESATRPFRRSGPASAGGESRPLNTVPVCTPCRACHVRVPSKIAQPFMAGTHGPQFSKVPPGTKEIFCRPSRDFYIWLTRYPAINGWAIVISPPRNRQPPIAPIVQPKMKTGKERFKCGMRPSSLPSSLPPLSDFGETSRYDAASCFDAARNV